MKLLNSFSHIRKKIQKNYKILDRAINIILYILLILISLYPAINGINLLVCSLFITLRIYRRRTLNKTVHWLRFGLLFLEYILITFLLYRSTTGLENLVFMIFVFELFFNYPLWFSIPFTYLGYCTYLIIWHGTELVLYQYFIETINFSFYIAALASTRILIQQKQKILNLNEKILLQNKLIEETTALKERNRIAEDMHDTIGHTLTASIVSLEGVEILISKNPDEALALLAKSRALLKDSLADVRETVRNLKGQSESAGVSLEHRLQKMIDETFLSSNLKVTFNYKLLLIPAPLYEYVIFNTVREALTNVLRHSKANYVSILLEEKNHSIIISVANNGDSDVNITYSFGLNTMNNRIKALGGELQLYKNESKGITLEAQIPIAYDLEEAYDKN